MGRFLARLLESGIVSCLLFFKNTPQFRHFGANSVARFSRSLAGLCKALNLLLSLGKPGREIFHRILEFLPLPAQVGDLLLRLVDFNCKHLRLSLELVTLAGERLNPRLRLGELLRLLARGFLKRVPFGRKPLDLFGKLLLCLVASVDCRVMFLLQRFELLPGLRQLHVRRVSAQRFVRCLLPERRDPLFRFCKIAGNGVVQSLRLIPLRGERGHLLLRFSQLLALQNVPFLNRLS